jgi:hypothetical protein
MGLMNQFEMKKKKNTNMKNIENVWQHMNYNDNY